MLNCRFTNSPLNAFEAGRVPLAALIHAGSRGRVPPVKVFQRVPSSAAIERSCNGLLLAWTIPNRVVAPRTNRRGRRIMRVQDITRWLGDTAQP